MTTSLPWRHRVGNQRNGVWRDWQTRYTYIRAAKPGSTTPLILQHRFGAPIAPQVLSPKIIDRCVRSVH